MNIRIIVNKHVPKQVKKGSYGNMRLGIMTELEQWNESRDIVREKNANEGETLRCHHIHAEIKSYNSYNSLKLWKRLFWNNLNSV